MPSRANSPAHTAPRRPLRLHADDIEWVLPGPADVPLFGTFHGKAGVQQWLGTMGEQVQFRALEPREFIAQGDKVVVLLHGESTLTRTSRDVVSEGVHVFTVRDGKVVRFVGNDDTAAIANAYRGR
ncbi:MAG TPA: nuclear transport factor 2 family protein [Ktedonobacterales bacterium]|nr:nuclear transport factor 2 family protein [Ktedonobacterales bacterium]